MKFTYPFFILLILSVSISSCVSLVGYEEGRSLGEEATSITASINGLQSPDFSEEDVEFFNIPFIMNGEISAKHGISDKFDVGMRLNSFLNIGINGKYQFVGDKKSPFAMAIGAEVNSFAFSRLFNIHFPLMMSYYPKDNITLNLSPRYVVQFGSFDTEANSLNYFGGNVGLMIGRKHKFGIDLGFYKVDTPEQTATLYNFGIGGKFVFGGIK